MLDTNISQNYSGPTTTADSSKEGRLKVDTGGIVKKKKQLLKKLIKLK